MGKLWQTRVVSFETATTFEKKLILKNLVSEQKQVIDLLPSIPFLLLSIALFCLLTPLLSIGNNFALMLTGMLMFSILLAALLKYKAWMWHGFIAVERPFDWFFYVFQLFLSFFTYAFLLYGSPKASIKLIQ